MQRAKIDSLVAGSDVRQNSSAFSLYLLAPLGLCIACLAYDPSGMFCCHYLSIFLVAYTVFGGKLKASLRNGVQSKFLASCNTLLSYTGHNGVFKCKP